MLPAGDRDHDRPAAAVLDGTVLDGTVLGRTVLSGVAPGTAVLACVVRVWEHGLVIMTPIVSPGRSRACPQVLPAGEA
jgi:hypothetical protein